ncbi:MAG: triose-phosphate isomerase [Rhodobiaceae bacterium]|nr:triose-phosphate isomerase [Rhodobiaceae bacterium]
MAGSHRKPLIAGNWKMNGTSASLDEARKIAEGAQGYADVVDVMLCPPATLIARMDLRCAGTDLLLGGQDCHVAVSGAHTGDISAEMLVDAGASAVIVGHSERRTDHKESSHLINEKAKAAHRAGLTAIICVGETDIERKSGQAINVVGEQIRLSLPASTTAQNVVVAYEPVWAIGTGLTPTTNDISDMHGAIRNMLADRFGEAAAAAIRVLYGGSVKPGNAGQLLRVENVDGALVGGAALKAQDLLAIIGAYVSRSGEAG